MFSCHRQRIVYRYPAVPGKHQQAKFLDECTDLDLTNGVMTVEDLFTPHNQAELTGQDGDLGSGGPMLLPTQTLTSGKTITPILEIGKTGTVTCSIAITLVAITPVAVPTTSMKNFRRPVFPPKPSTGAPVSGGGKLIGITTSTMGDKPPVQGSPWVLTPS